MENSSTFEKFKELCVREELVRSNAGFVGDDLRSGIDDDGTLRRFLRACDYDIDSALQRYRETCDWRDANALIDMYDTLDISDYEETRKMYTHWTGRRDRSGAPLSLFEIQKLTPNVMAAYNASCSTKTSKPTSTESEAMLRLFCTYENLTRFVLPLCSMVRSRPDPDVPITNTTCIVDVTGVSLMQFWRLRSHMQAASTLASSHYPETLGKTFIIGAPSFFPTIWAWIGKWFSPNTVAKICIVPAGQEYSVLAETIDPQNIPTKYGGDFDFDFGMLPDLDHKIVNMMQWSDGSNKEAAKELPIGQMRWIRKEDGKYSAVAVGSVHGDLRRSTVMTVL